MTNEIIKKQTEKIISKNEASLQKQVSSSLLGKIKARSDSKALLLDVSSSMCELVDLQSKHEILCNSLKDLEDQRKFAFSSACAEVLPLQNIPKPNGGTNLAGAFIHVKSKGIKHVILITDGHPDNSEYAMRESEGLKIDIIYIGPDPIPEFLRRLANKADGSFENIKLLGENSTRLLGSKIKGFLA